MRWSGEATLDEPKHILDFPVNHLQELWRISQNYFDELWDAAVLLKALHFIERPEAYTIQTWKFRE